MLVDVGAVMSPYLFDVEATERAEKLTTILTVVRAVVIEIWLSLRKKLSMM